MVDIRADEQLGFRDEELRVEEGAVVPGFLSKEARISAGLVGPRSAVRARALALVLSAIGAFHAGCAEPATAVGRDKDNAVDVQPKISVAVNAMFMEQGAKLLGYAEKPTSFMVKLKDKNGKTLREEAHDVGIGDYNLDVKFSDMHQVQTLEVVNEGHTFTFKNSSSVMPEMPGR